MSKDKDLERFTDSINEFAGKIGVGSQTIRMYIKKGRMPTAVYVSPTGRYYIDPIVGEAEIRKTSTRDSSVLRAVKQQQAAAKYKAEGREPAKTSAVGKAPIDPKVGVTIPGAPSQDDDEIDVDQLIDGIPAVMVSKAKREFYLAAKAQLEHEESLGKKIDIDLAQEDTLKCYRDCRDSLLKIPSKTSAVLAGMDNVDEIEVYLDSFLRQSLTDLASALNKRFNIE